MEPEPKAGYKTSEMWITLGSALLTLLIGYGVMTTEEAEAWRGVMIAAVPLSLSIITAAYSISRGQAKRKA